MIAVGREVRVESVAWTEDGVAVSFTASDNVAVYDAFLVYVNGEENQLLLDDCTYDEETGVYTAEVPCEELDETAVNEFGVYVMDYAGNGARGAVRSIFTGMVTVCSPSKPGRVAVTLR